MKRALDWGLGLYFITCAFFVVWPGYAWVAARDEPIVLGLPLAFAWMVGWIVATFLVLCGYHFLRGRV